MRKSILLALLGLFVCGPGVLFADKDAPSVIEFNDPTYGSRILHLKKDDGHEHNLYYCRNPWNADASRMIGIQSDLQQKNWRVALHDGNGRFQKVLFTPDRYDWRLVWDRKNSEILYTWKGADLFRFNVMTGNAERLKSFAPLSLKPNGPSLNQAGDRILVITSDNMFRSYSLPDMGDERSFKAAIPPGCSVSWDKPAYTGYRNHIHVAYASSNLTTHALLLFEDSGKLVHRFEKIGGGGHYDFSPNGKLAYFKMPGGPRSGAGTPLEIHVVNVDGSDDRVLYQVSRAQAAYVHNLHLSWPDQVNDWFVASFFPNAPRLPATYAPPMDEIAAIHLDGTVRFLARTGTAYSAPGGRGKAGDMFWAQSLGSPSSDGRRICFNSNRAGTIDQYIVFPPEGK